MGGKVSKQNVLTVSDQRKLDWSDPASIDDFLARRIRQIEALNARNALWPKDRKGKAIQAEKDAVIYAMLREDMNALTSLRSVDDIDILISRFYNLIPESDATKTVRKLKGFGRGVETWDVIDSSGKNFDCLIHSILTALCENFRRLAKADKEEFANFFRRTILLTFPTFLCLAEHDTNQAKQIQKAVMAKSFLDDSIIFILQAELHFNALLARQDSTTGNRFQLVSSDDLISLLPPQCSPPDGRWPTVCVYTQGSHFESVRSPTGYRITNEQVASAISSSENAEKNTGKWICPLCTFVNPKAAKHCEMCGGVKNMGINYQAVKSAQKKEGKSVKKCPDCTFNNPAGAKKCEICAHSLKGGARRRTRKA